VVQDDDGGDAVSLVRLSGTRPSPSPEATAAARAHVHAAWRAGVARRRFRAGLVLAAAGLAAMAMGYVTWRGTSRAPDSVTAPPAVLVARLDAAPGLVEWESPSGWTRLTSGDSLPAGGRLRTGPTGAGLRVADGRSVRLAGHSRLRWETADRLSLEAGAVYVDSGRREASSSSFEVATAWGRVRESGTQFEVRLEAAGLRVRVREGRASVLRGNGEAGSPTDDAREDVASGTELRIDERGAVRRTIATHGREWSWALALCPDYAMDGRVLDDVARWAAREAGWELRYTDAESRRRAEAAVLHGSIGGLTAEEAVAAAIPSTGMPYRLEDGVLWIGPRPATSETH
jgi:ferric-dicitrate binding protein FerR (iron transport regulator)